MDFLKKLLSNATEMTRGPVADLAALVTSEVDADTEAVFALLQEIDDALKAEGGWLDYPPKPGKTFLQVTALPEDICTAIVFYMQHQEEDVFAPYVDDKGVPTGDLPGVPLLSTLLENCSLDMLEATIGSVSDVLDYYPADEVPELRQKIGRRLMAPILTHCTENPLKVSRIAADQLANFENDTGISLDLSAYKKARDAHSVTSHLARDEDLEDTELGRLVLKMHHELRAAFTGSRYGSAKLSQSKTYKAFKKSPPEKQADLARFMMANKDLIFRPSTDEEGDSDRNWRGHIVFEGLMSANQPAIAAEELLNWVLELIQHSEPVEGSWRVVNRIDSWPFAKMLKRVQEKADEAPLSVEAVRRANEILDYAEKAEKSYSFKALQDHPLDADYSLPFYYWKNHLFRDCYSFFSDFEHSLKPKLEAILMTAQGEVTSFDPEEDDFGKALSKALNGVSADEGATWLTVFKHAALANGSKPDKTFLKQARAIRADTGEDWFENNVKIWLNHALQADLKRINHYRYYLTDTNMTLVKGLIWMCIGLNDAELIGLNANLAEKAMTPVPGVGPCARSVATAAIRYLEATPGELALARLARLQTSIKFKNVRDMVADILDQKASEEGLTPAQLAERIVPEFGLTEGSRTEIFGDFRLRIDVEGPGSVVQTWLKADGSIQKSKPKAVSENDELKSQYKDLRTDIDELKKVLSAQRDRIDLLFAEEVDWPLVEIEDFYLQHGLVGVLATRLIWLLMTGDVATAAIWRDGDWFAVDGSQVQTEPATRVRLWHPIDCTTQDVTAWRKRLAELNIRQPFKQAYREVYPITPAELETATYSNRMAAHLLKQHQMTALMRARGWQFQLMSYYDAEDVPQEDDAVRSFVTCRLQAQYLISSGRVIGHEAWNDSGMYYTVGTGRIRFVDPAGHAVRLDAVPARIFSETMREADLFVGVASVGNDPTWLDQGDRQDRDRDYWETYSFGKLDGFAQTRKQVLEDLLPRLKIRNVARLEGNFLIVDGKLSSYKIHLGSSNILMSPGDRYLCIVKAGTSGRNVALPFDGDDKLSVILSKAIMLAADDKITAPDIVAQLKI